MPPAHATAEPAPNTLVDHSLVRGRLLAAEDAGIVLGLSGTDYRLHLVTDAPTLPDAVGCVRGRILADAMRVDVVETGGRYLEPVYGRPRRLQGAVLAVDARRNAIVVQGPCPFVCALTADQRAEDFQPGQLVSFDMKPGVRFDQPDSQGN